MMTPKEALLKDGTITVKGGRGRMSREAVARIQYLVGQGWSIKGYETVKPKVGAVSPSTAAPVEVKRVPVSGAQDVREFTILWDESAYKAIDADKNEHSMRWVCDQCRVSLVQCGCGRPSIHQGLKLTIKPR